MCKSLLSSVGSGKNRWLTTQRFDQYALIVFRRMSKSSEIEAMYLLGDLFALIPILAAPVVSVGKGH